MSRNLNKREINTLAEIIARTSPEAFIAAYNNMMPSNKVYYLKARVLVTVSGGNAEVETSGAVDYDICDFDNLESEGLDSRARNHEYQKLKRWLNTGPVEEEAKS